MKQNWKRGPPSVCIFEKGLKRTLYINLLVVVVEVSPVRLDHVAGLFPDHDGGGVGVP